MKVITKQDYQRRRHLRLRRKVQGTAERPRLCVHISNRYMYIQFVDDIARQTLVAATTQQEGETQRGNVNAEVAAKLGKAAAVAAQGKGISKVVFDRGGLTYGARLRAFADAAREAGLVF